LAELFAPNESIQPPTAAMLTMFVLPLVLGPEQGWPGMQTVFTWRPRIWGPGMALDMLMLIVLLVMALGMFIVFIPLPPLVLPRSVHWVTVWLSPLTTMPT